MGLSFAAGQDARLFSTGGCDAQLENPCPSTAPATGAGVGSPADLVSGLGLKPG